MAAPATPDPEGRARPRLHFTTHEGWINDPYGVSWVGDAYHLYFQAVPGAVSWAPSCHWGHATSPDLVSWSERPLALVPREFEVGCWSGSVVPDAAPPTIFYTRIDGGNREIGKVARASFQASDHTWHTSARDVVVDAPPPTLGVTAFRDPYVFRRGDGWAMLMAAALADDTAAVLQYVSDDLVTWRYDGVLCSRRDDQAAGVRTGTLWECPHLFPLEGRTVLLVSVAAPGRPDCVVAAVGSYDGHEFVAATWQRLTYGTSAYAMTAFLDRAGRRCVLSWLREDPAYEARLHGWAGAHSLVSTLSFGVDGQLVMAPHPDVDALRGRRALASRDRGGLRIDLGTNAAEIITPARPGVRWELRTDGQRRLALSVAADRSVVLVERPGQEPDGVPIREAGVASLRLILDADIAELFTSTAYAAYRLPPCGELSATSLLVSGERSRRVRVNLLTPPSVAP